MSIARDRSECTTDWAACSMMRTTYVSHRSSNLIIGLYSMSVILYGTGVLAALPGDLDDVDEQLEIPERELFLKMKLPFESNISPVYEVVMITQFFHQLAAATIVGVLNALIVSLVSESVFETKAKKKRNKIEYKIHPYNSRESLRCNA